MSRILVVLFSAIALLAQAQDRRITPVDGGRRLALVMGNRAYVRNPLTNPLNDAQDMQRALTADGFQVTVATDTTLKAMQKSIREFGASVRAGDTALFYYSGHGLQVRGVNYLLPIDFQAQSDDAVPDEAYPAQRVQELLEQAGARFRIVILDACRDNPLPSSKSLGRGLAPMNGGEGTYIVFATAENTVASDNPGQRNGLFTKHLLSVMDQPGLTLDQVLKETKRRVAQESRNLQRPWIYSDATEDFYFRPGPTHAVAHAPVTQSNPMPAPSEPKQDPTPSNPCATGCSVKLSDLVAIKQYDYADSRQPLMKNHESVYRLPAGWPVGPYLHVVTITYDYQALYAQSGGVSKSGTRMTPEQAKQQAEQMQLSIPPQLHLAATDRQQDSDARLFMTAAAGYGNLARGTDGQTYQVKFFGPGNFPSSTMELKPASLPNVVGK